MFPVLKILTPKVLKAIMAYVFEDNNLDQQMESVRSRLDKLEDVAHPIRDFVTCECCKKKLKQKEKYHG